MFHCAATLQQLIQHLHHSWWWHNGATYLLATPPSHTAMFSIVPFHVLLDSYSSVDQFYSFSWGWQWFTSFLFTRWIKNIRIPLRTSQLGSVMLGIVLLGAQRTGLAYDWWMRMGTLRMIRQKLVQVRPFLTCTCWPSFWWRWLMLGNIPCMFILCSCTVKFLLRKLVRM